MIKQADPVADPVLVDLLAQPHQEDAAAGHDGDRYELPGQVEARARFISRSLGLILPPPGPEADSMTET